MLPLVVTHASCLEPTYTRKQRWAVHRRGHQSPSRIKCSNLFPSSLCQTQGQHPQSVRKQRSQRGKPRSGHPHPISEEGLGSSPASAFHPAPRSRCQPQTAKGLTHRKLRLHLQHKVVCDSPALITTSPTPQTTPRNPTSQLFSNIA